MAELPAWWNDVKAPMKNHGVDIKTWLPILLAESGGDPLAHNQGTRAVPEDSVGLFQLNRRGGQGVGYTVAQLKNPGLNAEIAARFIAPALNDCRKAGRGTIQCVAISSGHPGPVAVDDRRIVWIAQLATAIQTAKTDEEAWRLGIARYRQGPGSGGGSDPVPAPGEGGGGWGLGLPDLQSFADAFWQGGQRTFLGPFGANLPPEDLAWSVAFWIGGIGLVSIGLIGLAVGSGAVSTALAATPQTRGVMRAVRVGSNIGAGVAGAATGAYEMSQTPGFFGEAAAVL